MRPNTRPNSSTRPPIGASLKKAAEVIAGLPARLGWVMSALELTARAVVIVKDAVSALMGELELHREKTANRAGLERPPVTP